MGEIIGLVAVTLIFGIPIVKIWTDHQRKVLEMRLQLNKQGDTGVRAELEALRKEVNSLRDTSMQYDLSFDTALQRMEQRVEAMERRALQSAPDDQIQLGNRR